MTCRPLPGFLVHVPAMITVHADLPEPDLPAAVAVSTADAAALEPRLPLAPQVLVNRSRTTAQESPA